MSSTMVPSAISKGNRPEPFSDLVRSQGCQEYRLVQMSYSYYACTKLELVISHFLFDEQLFLFQLPIPCHLLVLRLALHCLERAQNPCPEFG